MPLERGFNNYYSKKQGGFFVSPKICDRNSFLTASEQWKQGMPAEIEYIVERVGCCTRGQLLEYMLRLRDTVLHAVPWDVTDVRLGAMLDQLYRSGAIRMQLTDSRALEGGENSRLVYSTRFPQRKAIPEAVRRYGVAMMATIIPFLPNSKAVYQIDSPLSFTFLSGDTQVEVAIIEPGMETMACSVLNRRTLPASVDKNTLVRIAVVADEQGANRIVGGGFQSVCIVRRDKLTQVRTIPPEEAWRA